ncbi:MAG: sigma-54-dependent Fis family transcriptional regulator [Alphaproteobacteria bacterium]|nr:sigma-54-dependent Fis family transcriptional regulator [Alphaproteobacteria bacterium SS10]
MLARKPNILIVEDAMVLAETYRAFLGKHNLSADIVNTVTEGEQHLAQQEYDVMLLDLGLPDRNGTELLEGLDGQDGGPATIVITADGSINRAVEAMRLGAFDFLVKPFNEDRLVTAVNNALDAAEVLRGVNNEAPAETIKAESLEGMIGRAPAMNHVRSTIASVAQSKVPVFITGESGTGKEVCATAIHKAGDRKDKPFIAINCAAIPKDLMESELFGHIKGAFTGATSHRLGAAQAADGGTLFLDEICEMDISLQSKLLRFLQTGQVKKVGAETDEKVDVRIICATNRDPMAEIAAGRFREDLYYRLHVVPLNLPPLRDRRSDIPLLLSHFVSTYAADEGKRFDGFTSDALERLEAYPWPGNIRELQNTVRHIVVMNPGGTVKSEDLPEYLGRGAPPAAAGMGMPAQAAIQMPGDPQANVVHMPLASPAAQAQVLNGLSAEALLRPLWKTEKDIIEAVIQHCNGNISRAARILEISPSTIYRKREQWEKWLADEMSVTAVN